MDIQIKDENKNTNLEPNETSKQEVEENNPDLDNKESVDNNKEKKSESENDQVNYKENSKNDKVESSLSRNANQNNDLEQMESKLKFLKSKHQKDKASADMDFENSDKFKLDEDDLLKRQKLIHNPKFHTLLEMVDPELARGAGNTSVIINYNNNTYINNINSNQLVPNYTVYNANDTNKLKVHPPMTNINKIKNLANEFKSFSSDVKYSSSNLNPLISSKTKFYPKKEKQSNNNIGSFKSPPENKFTVVDLEMEKLFSNRNGKSRGNEKENNNVKISNNVGSNLNDVKKSNLDSYSFKFMFSAPARDQMKNEFYQNKKQEIANLVSLTKAGTIVKNYNIGTSVNSKINTRMNTKFTNYDSKNIFPISGDFLNQNNSKFTIPKKQETLESFKHSSYRSRKNINNDIYKDRLDKFSSKLFSIGDKNSFKSNFNNMRNFSLSPNKNYRTMRNYDNKYLKSTTIHNNRYNPLLISKNSANLNLLRKSQGRKTNSVLPTSSNLMNFGIFTENDSINYEGGYISNYNSIPTQKSQGVNFEEF